MSYLRKNLMPNEQLVAETTLHWVIFLKPAFYLLIFIGYLVYRPAGFPPIITLMAEVFLAIVWFMTILRYLTTEFAVSKQRVLRKQGYIQVQTADLLVSRIESVQLQQSILGSMLGYGTVMVNGTGGDRLVYLNINDPAAFRQKILEQTDTIAP